MTQTPKALEMNAMPHQIFTSTRSGSVLILVILMLSLMVSMAIGFMSIVGRQLGSSINVACQTKADVAVQQAQAHVIKTFIESVVEIRNDANAVVPYTTTFNPAWRKEFAAVTDPDGDPFTEDGLPKRAGVSSSSIASSSLVSDHNLVNSRIHLFDMVGADTGSTGDVYGCEFGFGLRTAADKYISRWHNIEYLSESLEHIEIDPSLSEAAKAVLRKSARYVVRYMAQAMDVNGMRCVNHNFPTELQNGTSIYPGPESAAVNDLHYLRYQNYLACYGRSLKSQFSSSSDFVQFRSDDTNFVTVDPLDHETASVFVDGQYTTTYYTPGLDLDLDARLRLERAFRGESLQWMNGSLYGNLSVLSAGHKGRLYTWGHLTESLMGKPLEIYNYSIYYTLTPYADSMQDADLADSDLVAAGYVKPAAVSTPWRVNLLTAPNTTLGQMVRGLSSELRFSTSNSVVSKGTGSANVDLLGKPYPEAFPLSLDAGRDVPLVGDGLTDNGVEAPFWYTMNGSGGTYVFINPKWSTYTAANPGYQNSYLVDIALALQLAIRDARQVWVNEQPLATGATKAGPDIYEYINGVNDSYIVNTVTDPDLMLNLVLRETYRILGEGRIIAGSPATSEDFYAPGQPSLLGGGLNFVGAGSDKHYQRLGQLPPTANTRAMEYALNDFMISLFGKANPNFDVENDALSENIAVDFNGDGIAESSVTGWIDHETGLRTWSWWWDGLGPYVKVDSLNEYMKKPGWYRFDGLGNIKRKDGESWIDVPDKASFETYNDIWLTGNQQYPIKPFAKTGRFFIGKSKVFYGFVRGEVYNLITNETMAALDRNFAYKVDPNEDGDFSDNHLLIQTDATIVPKL